MSIAELQPIAGPMPHTPEWHAEHKRRIGGSSAAAAVGLSIYKTPLQVYLEMCDLVAPKETSDAMRLGNALEPVVISEYQHRTGLLVEAPQPMFFHPVHEFICSTPDGMVLDGATRKALDAKTSTFRRAHEFGNEWSDELPDDCVIQGQQHCLVMDVEECDFPVLFDGRTLRVFTVHRNERLISHMIAAERELVERVQNRDAPPPDFTHRSTPDLIKSMHGVTESLTVDLDQSCLGWWLEYVRLGAEIGEREKQRELAQARLLHLMGDAAIGVLPSGQKLERKIVKRKAYSVEALTYTQLKERKAKKNGDQDE